jgi:hypothetical protein
MRTRTATSSPPPSPLLTKATPYQTRCDRLRCELRVRGESTNRPHHSPIRAAADRAHHAVPTPVRCPEHRGGLRRALKPRYPCCPEHHVELRRVKPFDEKGNWTTQYQQPCAAPSTAADCGEPSNPATRVAPSTTSNCGELSPLMRKALHPNRGATALRCEL